MSTRRSLILAGTTTLVLSTLPLATAGAADTAAPGTPSPGAASASASPAGPSASAPRLDGSLQRGLEPSVSGVPKDFEVGGAAEEFGYTIANPSAHDFVAFPLLKFKNVTGDLRTADLRVEYQLPGRTDWLRGSQAPGSEGVDDGVLVVLGGRDGDNVADDALVAVRKGKSLALKVRVSFSAQAPVGRAGVAPVLFASQLDDATGQPVDRGSYGCACGVGCAGFRIKAPATVATPSPTRVPSPTATASRLATASPTVTAPPTAPAVTPSRTATPAPSSAAPTAPATTHTPLPTPTPTVTAPATTHAPSPTPTVAVPTVTTPPATTPAVTARPTTPSPTTPSTSSSAPAPVLSAPSASADPVGDGPLPLPVPIDNPTIAPLRIQPAAVVQARTTADAVERNLAQTGGGDHQALITGAGVATLAAGTGVLVLLRRRRAARHG
ncbi:LPXTG cell wall anchor domain-containing protein [Kitasatospora sp. NBC_01246]|uniref:LPXTG cell wall anchor domain-containing protein n=1 Tax=Kitasatospora sp. NBC_01246 TaxID=2903570 RepID=UPI002E36626B|nr:LPXTG cell wall anchor domain-containing protein [Kitasatospora sp. NBC_01246]